MRIDARVIAAADHQGMLLPRLIEGHDLLQMLPRQGRLTRHTECLSQGPMGCDEQDRVALSVGEADELFPEGARYL